MANPCPYQSKLSIFYQDKAKEELRENVSEIDEKLAQLRVLIENDSSLCIDTSNESLIRFLRHRKWNVEEAVCKIKKYCAVKSEYPNVFSELTAWNVRHLLESGISNVLPHKDRDGCRIVIFRPGKWGAHLGNGDIMQLARLNIIILSHLLHEEETQISGVSVIIDCSEMTWRHFRYISPTFIRTQREIMTRAVPIRVRKVVFLHGGSVFDTIFYLMSSILPQKLLNRIRNCGESVDLLHEELCPRIYFPSSSSSTSSSTGTSHDYILDKSILPSEAIFGGSGNISLPDPQFNQRLLNSDESIKKECI